MADDAGQTMGIEMGVVWLVMLEVGLLAMPARGLQYSVRESSSYVLTTTFASMANFRTCFVGTRRRDALDEFMRLTLLQTAPYVTKLHAV